MQKETRARLGKRLRTVEIFSFLIPFLNVCIGNVMCMFRHVFSCYSELCPLCVRVFHASFCGI